MILMLAQQFMTNKICQFFFSKSIIFFSACMWEFRDLQLQPTHSGDKTTKHCQKKQTRTEPDERINLRMVR